MSGTCRHIIRVYGSDPGNNSDRLFYMVKTNLSAHPEEGDEGHRIPGRHIACSLDRENGVRFFGHETPDFIMYEIYDSNNTCVGAYGDEPEFIDALFSLTGEYRISLSTAEVSYTGYILL